MRGTSKARPASALPKAPPPPPSAPVREPKRRKFRVLFVCIGNSCRSQMAEGFARAYGADVVEVQSAGVSPASLVAPLTIQTMLEKNVSLEGQFPKGLEIAGREPFDIVVNMSGMPITIPCQKMLEWTVRDPIGLSDSVYKAVAGEIEERVMRLILELRSA